MAMSLPRFERGSVPQFDPGAELQPGPAETAYLSVPTLDYNDGVFCKFIDPCKYIRVHVPINLIRGRMFFTCFALLGALLCMLRRSRDHRCATKDGPCTSIDIPGGSPLVIHDLCAKRNEYFVPPPSLLRPLIVLFLLKDPRDAPILYMLSNVVGFTLPFAFVVFSAQSHAVGFLYWLCNTLLFQERFILGMHYYAHRGLFRIPGLDTAFAFCMTPFFGLPGGLYHLHHVVMHHSENNLDGWDLSATERYQRDSLIHFVIYWLRFLLLIWFELPAYAIRRRRYLFAIECASAVVFFFCALRILYRMNPCGAMWVFAFPTLANSFLLMFGNWCQHMFVDPDKPRCNYHLAYNVINHPCNQRSFNDGYHIEHHVNSRKHWTELPSSFVANIERYKQEDAIVFSGLDNMQVGILVFRGRYDTLCKHLVNLRGDTERATAKGAERFLRRRLSPINNNNNNNNIAQHRVRE